jgi:hypothetical protein
MKNGPPLHTTSRRKRTRRIASSSGWRPAKTVRRGGIAANRLLLFRYGSPRSHHPPSGAQSAGTDQPHEDHVVLAIYDPKSPARADNGDQRIYGVFDYLSNGYLLSSTFQFDGTTMFRHRRRRPACLVAVELYAAVAATRILFSYDAAAADTIFL